MIMNNICPFQHALKINICDLLFYKCCYLYIKLSMDVSLLLNESIYIH